MKKREYAEEWADTIRPAILKRDNYRCKHCKIKHRAIGYYDYKNEFCECDEFLQAYATKLNFKLIKVILQVHHLNGNKKDNRPENLKTLCPRCHMAEEKELNRLKKITKGIIYPNK
jgi:5-methylcytosine-specific restriction endonuclease McrA